MNSDNLLELLQTGFRASVGATTSLVETLQDPQKLGEQVAEWAEKGEITEQEARRFIDSLLGQQASSSGRSSSTTTGTPSSTTTTTTSTTPTAPPNVQLELEELTARIAAIRTELETLRNPDLNR